MNVLAVEAHPDDAEILCAGTLVRLAKLGHKISILSVTAGELGSVTGSLEKTAQRALREAEESATILGGKFYCAGVPDKHIFFYEEQRRRVCEIFRQAAPDIVFAPSPKDYNLDHEFTSILARDAATAASVPQFSTSVSNPAPSVDKIPYLYYCDPIGRIDIFGDPVDSTTYVDITEVLKTKRQMMEAHARVAEWMRHRFGFDWIEKAEKWTADAGKSAGFAHAEGFRQHVAPPFPADNILANLLEALVAR